MSSIDSISRRVSLDAAWVWALAAGVAGVSAGLAVSRGVSAVQIGAAMVALVVVALVLWRYQIGAVLIVVTLPLDQYGRVLTSPVSVTLFHLALLLTLASWGLAVARGDATLRFSAVDFGLGGLVLAALWSLPFSLAPSATIFAAVRLVFLWAFTLLYANVLSSRRVFDWVTWTLLATGVGTALFALAQKYVPGFTYGSVRFFTESGGGGAAVRRVGAFFFDPNYLAGFLSVALLVALALVVHSKSWRRAVVCTVAAGIVGLGMFVTLSRTGLIGVAAGVVVIILTAPRKRVLPLLVALFAISVMVVLSSPAVIVDRVRSIGDPLGDTSNATRIYMFPAAYEIARDNWVFGTGMGAFRYAYPPYRRVQANVTVLKPHQIPLALWSETGVAGILAQLLLIWGLVRVFWRRRLRGWTAAESFALAGILSFGLQSLFQYYLYFEYVWLFIAFAIAANRIAQQEEAG